MHRLIATEHDIHEGTRWLVESCPAMARVHALTGPPPLRRRPGGFAGLARIVVGQQLSIASATAIWGRFEAAVAPFTAQAYLTSDPADLRAAGLSAGKVATLTTIAQAVASGTLHFDRLDHAGEDEVRATLTALKGVGPWTADIYLMFCLGRADAWAPGDLALRYAVADALGLAEAPPAVAMPEHAERWRPWRGVAARLLWAYYAARRKAAATPV